MNVKHFMEYKVVSGKQRHLIPQVGDGGELYSLKIC